MIIEPGKVTLNSIQQYQQACYQAGDLQYRIALHKIELKRINKRLRKLNIDAAREQEIAKKVAEEAIRRAEVEAQKEDFMDMSSCQPLPERL